MTDQNQPTEIDASETVVIMLIQQYAAKFGITFSSSLMGNEQFSRFLNGRKNRIKI